VSPISVHELSATDRTLIGVLDDVGVNILRVALVGVTPPRSNFRYDTVTGEPSTFTIGSVPKFEPGRSS